MARTWIERLDPPKHIDYMTSNATGGNPMGPTRDRLIERNAYFVAVCGFTFQFQSVEQIREALAYFEQKIHPTSCQPDITLEHYWQSWSERLPQWLFEEPKRRRVVVALQRATNKFVE